MKRQFVGLIVLITFFVGLISIIVVNSKYIFRSEPYYAETEVEQMCKDAYQQSIKDNSDTALYNKMSELTLKNLELTNKNKQLLAENETLNLNNTKKENIISEYEATIDNLNLQIEKLKNDKAILEENKSTNEKIIAELKIQVAELNKQINLLEYEISQNEEYIAENNKTIAQLQSSLSYYKDYLNGLETEDEVFAIFVVENEIFNIQKLNKNGLAYLETEPTFEENTVFNGWSVNEQIIDLTSYTLSCNTTFVADLTYTYNVNFIVDDEVYDSQAVVENNFANIPETPIKDGYIFEGWSLNKVDLIENIESTSVAKNLTYYAIFTKTYNVSFIVDNEIVSNQQVRVGSTAQDVDIESNEYKVFNGWTLNGEITDISSYSVYNDLTFIADITYYHKVDFMVDDSIYNSQFVKRNNYVSLPAEPTKTDLLFIGWSVNGSDIVSDITTFSVTENITYIALFELITVIQDISYNSTTIGTITTSENRTVITMVKGWKIDYASIKLLDNSKNYYKTNITSTSIVGPNISVNSSIVRYINGSSQGNSDFSYNAYINSQGQVIYTLSVGCKTSISVSITTASNYSKVTYVYFYGVSTTTEATDKVSEMSTCISSKSINDTNASTFTLLDSSSCANANIVGWAINVSEPWLSYSDYSNEQLVTDFIYLGDVGTIIDLSEYRNWTSINIFAVYSK